MLRTYPSESIEEVSEVEAAADHFPIEVRRHELQHRHLRGCRFHEVLPAAAGEPPAGRLHAVQIGHDFDVAFLVRRIADPYRRAQPRIRRVAGEPDVAMLLGRTG